VKLQIANYFWLTANPIIHDLKYHNRISSQPKVICYLQFHTCNWTGDQQSTVYVSEMDIEKQRQRRRDDARLTESENARSEQLNTRGATESLTNRVWLA